MAVGSPPGRHEGRIVREVRRCAPHAVNERATGPTGAAGRRRKAVARERRRRVLAMLAESRAGASEAMRSTSAQQENNSRRAARLPHGARGED